MVPGIDEFDSVVGIVYVNNWQNWSENFLLHNRIGWFHIN